jgi:hypothetical protein
VLVPHARAPGRLTTTYSKRDPLDTLE